MHVCYTITWLFAAFSLWGISASAEMIPWTSQSGKTIRAEFTGMTNNVVYLVSSSGKIMSVKISVLDQASAQKARELAGATGGGAGFSAPAPQAPAVAGPVNPYLKEMGVVAGVYNHPKFDAYFYEKNGQVDVFLKEDGEYKTKPLRIWLYVYYHNKSTGEWLPRRVKSVNKPPVYEKGRIIHDVFLDDGVSAQAYFYAHDNMLEMGYTVDDPNGLSYSSEHMMRVTVLPMDKEDIRTGTLTLDPEDGKTVIYTYQESIFRMVSPVKEWEIKGGVYGPHSVSMKVPKSNGTIQAYLYSGFTLADGYQLNVVKKNPSTKAGLTKNLAVLTVQ